MEDRAARAGVLSFTDNNPAKKTLHQIILGIWIVAGVVCVTGVWFVEYKLAYLAGEILGSAVATGLMFHLYHCLDIELDIGEAKARSHGRWNAILRIGIEIAVVAAACFIQEFINPVTVLTGLFGRKIGALMVPLFFDKERSGTMTEEDKEQLSRYGRLLDDREDLTWYERHIMDPDTAEEILEENKTEEMNFLQQESDK